MPISYSINVPVMSESQSSCIENATKSSCVSANSLFSVKTGTLMNFQQGFRSQLVPLLAGIILIVSGVHSAAVKIGNMYSFTPGASDADGDRLTFAIQNLPQWASFNADSGQLSGQPTLGNVGV